MDVTPCARGRVRPRKTLQQQQQPRKTISELIKKDMEINALLKGVIYDRSL
ncbi:MAG: hypothetical protein Q8877_03190 [Sweet potato little leaf phytoplasma]|nr:hypothetical protein [Sweet potato little leaf phytoplasma]